MMEFQALLRSLIWNQARKEEGPWHQKCIYSLFLSFSLYSYTQFLSHTSCSLLCWLSYTLKPSLYLSAFFPCVDFCDRRPALQLDLFFLGPAIIIGLQVWSESKLIGHFPRSRDRPCWERIPCDCLRGTYERQDNESLSLTLVPFSNEKKKLLFFSVTPRPR